MVGDFDDPYQKHNTTTYHFVEINPLKQQSFMEERVVGL
jgi:hypothetical protein